MRKVVLPNWKRPTNLIKFLRRASIIWCILYFSNWTGDGGGGGGGGDGETPMDCDVGIVGGGLAGLYMAESLLRHKKETKVCVFERDTRLGGRIYDYVFPQVPDESVGWWNNF